MTLALVLCGGLGTRLRPVVGDLPKALAPIEGRPFIDYLLDDLSSNGITHVVLCTGYGADRIAAHCGDGARWGLRIDASAEPEALGTGGAVKHAERFVTGDPFFVINGDSFVVADLNAARKRHIERGAAITMVVTEVADTARYGAVITGDDDAIERFVEKGRGGPGLINAGVYVMQRDVLNRIPGGRQVSMEHDFLPKYVGRGLQAFPVAGPFIDIGTPESFLIAPEILGYGR